MCEVCRSSLNGRVMACRAVDSKVVITVSTMEDEEPTGVVADAVAGTDTQGVVADTSIHPVYHSRLRAKREERMQHRSHAEAPHPNTDDIINPALYGSEPTVTDSGVRHGGHLGTGRSTPRPTGDEQRRRQRAEARRLLIAYMGTVWDAVRANDLVMLRNFFLVEGASKLVRAHCKSPGEFGRTLLHSAAWWGQLDVVKVLLAHGADVNVIDTTATRLTALMDAARAGHADVGEILLQNGADATLCDSSGDNAFHWAGRRAHGAVLLRLSLLLDTTDHNSLIEVWTTKNVRGHTPVDYIRSNSTVYPMIVKRLGKLGVPLEPIEKRRARFSPATSSPPTSQHLLSIGPSEVAGPEDSSSRSTTSATTSRLSGIDALGIDISSFAYKSRDSVRSH